jgi:hypothetical protein
MKIQHKRAVADRVFIVIGIFLSWLGGYNFDPRDFTVGYVVIVILVAAWFVAGAPYNDD